MTRRTDIGPELRGSPILRRELAAIGVPRSRIRANDVVRPFRGVHLIGHEPVGIRERAHALVPLLRPFDAFSHTTAALLLGAPLPWPKTTALHVTSVGSDIRIRRPGVIGHRAESLPTTMLGILPIVDPAHVWVQLATILTHDDLVAVGDYLVTPNRRARTPAIASIDALEAAVPIRARGAARARRALADVRVGAESPMETKLRLLLIRSGLPEPLLNPAIRIGDQTLHPDLLYPQWRVAIEYEGDHHRTDSGQWRHDIWRREVFASAGWRMMRVTSDDVLREREAFLARVCHVLASQL